MWPLDLALLALSALVLYLVLTQFSFEDPRPLYNAWTYILAVPLAAAALAVVLRQFASRYVQKSIQLGFLSSVFVHLLLLIVAFQWIVFPSYFQEAFTGVRPERSPIRETIPEYLFTKPTEESSTPDWATPVEAETASRVDPIEQRRLPPEMRTAPQLQVPQPKLPPNEPEEIVLNRRELPASAQPQPADQPAELARHERSPAEDLAEQSANPAVPDLAPAAQARDDPTVTERPDEPMRRNRRAAETINTAAPPDIPRQSFSRQSTDARETGEQRAAAAARRAEQSLPTVGELGAATNRTARSRSPSLAPAGAAPESPSVSIARVDHRAERVLAPERVTTHSRSDAAGAQLAKGNPGISELPTRRDVPSGAEFERNDLDALMGLPDIAADSRPRSSGRATRQTLGTGFEPAGLPDPAGLPSPADLAASADGPTADAAAARDSDDAIDRLSQIQGSRRSTEQRTGERNSTQPRSGGLAPSPETAVSPSLELLADRGPAGLMRRAGSDPGLLVPESPAVSSTLDLSRQGRPRLDVGGPQPPAGAEMSSIDSFSQRIARTSGASAPTPAGTVGPETEAAIERGLAYLAERQNEDGSWSLQGHGEEVLLHSDTAATGLSLLAFQGAGYTHRQHQYAGNVARGLKFLIDHQRTNGDLYRRENAASNQNVALYSHGIASLALCEAFGMTQDPELRKPAQMALGYIVATQHRRYGGWRYTPQVSADTSVTGWMMMALKSGELSGLEVPEETYDGIDRWLDLARPNPQRPDRYRYNPFAPDTPTQRHGRIPTPSMTSVGILMRMYSGWQREQPAMQSAADYLLEHPPRIGTPTSPKRDTYYWYYATQVMFHMGGDYWERWNRSLKPILLDAQIIRGPQAGSWDPELPIPDRWGPHGGRLYVTTLNLLNLEIYYRHLPIYEETAE